MSDESKICFLSRVGSIVRPRWRTSSHHPRSFYLDRAYLRAPSRNCRHADGAEIVGAIAIAQPWSAPLRVTAAWSLAAYALCVWPANVQHMLIDLSKPGHGLGLVYHVPRLAFQPVLIWWPLRAANIIAWPVRSH